MVFDINAVFDELKKTRSVFHIEADFQFAMAWAIQKLYPDYHVRLEYSTEQKLEGGKRSYVDIMVRNETEYILIELKYKTKKEVLVDSFTGEVCNLQYHGAPDLGVYSVLHDLERVENAVITDMDDYGRKPAAGYSILLTNDKKYTKPFKEGSMFHHYGFTEGKVFKADKPIAYVFPENTKQEDTCVKNKPEIILKRNHTVHWQSYSSEIPYMLIFEVKR